MNNIKIAKMKRYTKVQQIEIVHKVLLQKKLKQPETYWKKDDSQYIAYLRTKYKSEL